MRCGLGEASYHAGAISAWRELADAAERLEPTGEHALDVRVRLFRASCRAAAGQSLGLRPGDLETIGRLTDPAELAWAGGMARGVGRRDLARSVQRRAARRARALGAAGTLAWVLDRLVANDVVRGRFDAAEAQAEEGLRFAEETGQPNVACLHRASLAMLAALRGRQDQAWELAERVLSEAIGRSLASASATAYRALGMLELAAGRPDAALVHFEAIDWGTITHPAITFRAVPERIEAAVRTGEPGRVTELFRGLTHRATVTAAPELMALQARCRALLEDDETAYHDALDLHARSDQPMERARTELLLGEHLRRMRRRSDARDHLRVATETFQRLGASAWSGRARAELRAAGETTRQPEPAAPADFTPQEWRIVSAVREGATNREIAAQLFLSPRTVDYHLSKVFRKLGISSRAQLIRLQPGERPGITDEDVPGTLSG